MSLQSPLRPLPIDVRAWLSPTPTAATDWEQQWLQWTPPRRGQSRGLCRHTKLGRLCLTPPQPPLGRAALLLSRWVRSGTKLNRNCEWSRKHCTQHGLWGAPQISAHSWKDALSQTPLCFKQRSWIYIRKGHRGPAVWIFIGSSIRCFWCNYVNTVMACD